MAKRLMVCRNCRRFTTEKVCPSCKSTNLSSSWKGLIILINKESELAKAVGISEEGRYAIYVG
jgi:DNA-directed RNA polymerase subunit E"